MARRTLRSLVGDGRLGSWFSLLRQGISLETEFGTHSLETLVSVAETVEQSVYEQGSLARTPSGIVFRMNNPPLRTGAFSGMRVGVDGAWSRPADTRVRVGHGPAVRSCEEISRERPLLLRPGDPIEISVSGTLPVGRRELSVRLELQSVAIPPLVWFEFTDKLADPSDA